MRFEKGRRSQPTFSWSTAYHGALLIDVSKTKAGKFLLISCFLKMRFNSQGGTNINKTKN